MKLINSPHKRLNRLTGEWILISPQRLNRPWQGLRETNNINIGIEYDKNCYLCPGNIRSSGIKNPNYKNTHSFINDYSALNPEAINELSTNTDLFVQEPIRGICKVVCFSPNHSLTLPLMSIDEILKVIDLWKKEFLELSKIQWIHHIQIFENKGEIMGCSNPHPHGQIWAQNDIPNEVIKENHSMAQYYQKHGTSLLEDYLLQEMKQMERIIYINNSFTALVPYWATWPFEILIISRRHFQNILEMHDEEILDLADILKNITTRYDNLFQTSFPYSAGMHQGPVNDGIHPEWHWHMHFYPPLLRSATIKKFMVGYELLASAQRDITPETAAQLLKDQSTDHYSLIKS